MPWNIGTRLRNCTGRREIHFKVRIGRSLGVHGRKRPEFRVRTGDRYLGHEQWEHYLGFEEHPSSAKEIKLSMIRLALESVPDVYIRPGSRYALVKVTNSNMTVRKGRWSWAAQEMHSKAIFHVYALKDN
jgi:hypothetical protein